MDCIKQEEVGPADPDPNKHCHSHAKSSRAPHKPCEHGTAHKIHLPLVVIKKEIVAEPNPGDDGFQLKEENSIKAEEEEDNGLKNTPNMCLTRLRKLSNRVPNQNSTLRPYRCPECPQLFTRASTLKRHLQIHFVSVDPEGMHKRTVGRPNMCATCGRSYRKYCRFCSLRKIEHRHACSTCGKAFNTSTHLLVHERIHTGQKPFTCNDCGKAFRQINHLKGHLMIHTGEKPYKCQHCEKSFRDHSTLRQHLQRHTQERLSCPYCLKYVRSKHLLDHMRSHKDETSHGCLICDQEFSDKPGLARHIKAQHKEELTQTGQQEDKNPIGMSIGTKTAHVQLQNDLPIKDDLEIQYATINEYSSQDEIQDDIRECPPHKHVVKIAKKADVCKKIKLEVKPHTESDGHQEDRAPQASVNTRCDLMANLEQDLVITPDGDSAIPQDSQEGQEKVITNAMKETVKSGYGSSTYLETKSRSHDETRGVSGESSEASKMSLQSTLDKYSTPLGLRKHLDDSGGGNLCTNKNPVCDRALQTPDMRKHLCLRTREKLYKCDVCGLGFTHKNHRSNHQKTHFEEHLYKCGICSKGFNILDTLRIHVQGHTGDLPHKCSICGKGFRSKAHLQRHLTLHSNERPFQCVTCGKCFKTKQTLTIHCRSHR